MGIKSLHQFLRKKCPELYQTIHLSDLAYKKVAVDVSLFMFKYKAIAGDKWLHAFINLILSLVCPLICIIRTKEIPPPALSPCPMWN